MPTPPALAILQAIALINAVRSVIWASLEKNRLSVPGSGLASKALKVRKSLVVPGAAVLTLLPC